ncbi:MAG: hypothetical protein ACT4OK_13655 [Gemmobacter sp.]
MSMFSSEPGSTGTKADGDKPRIWAGGRQRPAFDARAFLRVATGNSRALAAPLLTGLAGRLDRLGIRVEDGTLRIPPARLGKTGQWLPGHVATGRRLQDSAAMTRLAAEAARGLGPVEPMAFRGWADGPAAPAPAPVVAAAPEPAIATVPPLAHRPKRPAPLPAAPVGAAGDRDTLEAIRTLMATSVVEPVHPLRKAPAAPPPPTGAGVLPELAPAEPTPRGPLFKFGGRMMGFATVGLVYPAGMAKAAFAVAKGEDLRLVP